MSYPNPFKSRVYFARCVTDGGIDMKAIKIGCSHDIDARVAGLQASMPFRCEVLASFPGHTIAENFLHMWLHSIRIRGEFFHDAPELMELIAYVQEHEALPFPIEFCADTDWVNNLDLPEYLRRKKLTMRSACKLAGVTSNYPKLLEQQPSGNRRVVAAVMVGAVKAGHRVRYPKDFPKLRVSGVMVNAGEAA